MKAGDLVRFNVLNPYWGEYGLITEVRTEPLSAWLVYLLTKDGIVTIPHFKKDKYMDVISECG